MYRLATIFSIVFAVAFARTAHICEVVLPGFDDSLAPPTFSLGSSRYSLDNFNAISFDSFYAVSGDVEGRTAIRNNLNLPNGQYSFGYELRTGGVSAIDNSLPASLLVGHNAVFNGGAILPDGSQFPYPGAREGMHIGGTFSGTPDLASRIVGTGNRDSEFDYAQSYYTAVSAGFAAVTSNVVPVTIQYGGLTLTCPSFTGTSWTVEISAADFSTVTWYTINNCNPDAQVVFNIRGTSQVKFAGATQTFFRNERVVYNIVDGAPVRVEVGVNGNLLAPNSQYNQPGMGVFIGQVIAGNMVQVLQINRINCQPIPDEVTPETFCPSFETDCAGLNVNLGGATFSLRDFNAISFGNFVANTGDVEGRLAVRGNVNLGAGYSIGYELNTANNMPDRSLPYSLIAGGNVTWISGAIFPAGNGIPHGGNREDMFVGENFSGSQDLAARATGTCSTPACLEAEFADAKACYDGYSATAAAKTDNVAKVNQYAGAFLTCNDNTATEYVVSFTAAEISAVTYYSVANCNFQAGWIINIVGTEDVTLSGDSFPAIPGAVVYNVQGSRTVTVRDTSLTGHLLAPSATVNQPGGVIIGKVVAGDIVMSLQINKQDTCPDIVTVRLPIVARVSAQQGERDVHVYGASSFRVGDVTDAGTIYAINGDVITFSAPLTRPVSAGTIVTYASLRSTAGRAQVANPDMGSASVAGVAIAAMTIAALLL